MGTMAFQITSLTSVYSTVYSGADQRKHQNSAALAFVWEIHRGPVNSPHKWPVTRKMFPFDDIIMYIMLYPFNTTHNCIEQCIYKFRAVAPGKTPYFAWRILYTLQVDK